MSKLCTNSSSSFSSSSSPSTTSAPSPSMEVQIDLQPLLQQHEPMQTNAADDGGADAQRSSEPAAVALKPSPLVCAKLASGANRTAEPMAVGSAERVAAAEDMLVSTTTTTASSTVDVVV